MQVSPVATLPKRLVGRGREIWPGLAVCVLIAAAAAAIGRFVPLVGSAIPAVVIGVAVSLVRRPSARIAPGVTYSSKFVLQLAVVLLGSQLSLQSIVTVGAESLPVMLVSLAVCLLGAWLIGRAMRIERDIRTLIGVGTGICGASAIAVVEARREGRGQRITAGWLLKLVPWFLVGFLLVAGIASTGLISPAAASTLNGISVFLVATALAGVGLSTNVAAIRTAGLRPLALGGILSLIVTGTTLGMMFATGRI